MARHTGRKDFDRKGYVLDSKSQIEPADERKAVALMTIAGEMYGRTNDEKAARTLIFAGMTMLALQGKDVLHVQGPDVPKRRSKEKIRQGTYDQKEGK